MQLPKVCGGSEYLWHLLLAAELIRGRERGPPQVAELPATAKTSQGSLVSLYGLAVGRNTKSFFIFWGVAP